MVKTRSTGDEYSRRGHFDVCRSRRSRNLEEAISDHNDSNGSEEEPVRHCTRSQDKRVRIQEGDHADREDYSPGRSSPRRRTRKPIRYRETEDYEPVDAAYNSKSRRELHRRQFTSSMAVPSPRGHGYSYDEPRRSGRTRKLTYDTLNSSLMAMMSHTDNEDEGHMNLLQNEENQEEPVIQRKKRKTIEVDPMPEEEMTNMYERVKRPRRQVKRDMYGRPLEEEVKDAEDEGEGQRGEDESSAGDSDSSEEESSSEVEEEQPKGYSLRENKPRTQMLEINWQPARPRRNRTFNVFHESTPPPPRRKSTVNKVYHKSPARKRKTFRRRRAAFHGSSSTSSSSSSSGGDSENDERQFERRKSKSMVKSRQRCLPMNFVPEDLSSGVLKDRSRIGASLADIDPMSLDKSVNFDSVGGLGKHVRALKEMIVFPLLYPEVFERFKIQPPRGVLFYGPPGTGKTLVARALANECSIGEKKVAFFMRKGADCLSKWVGESERQLRLLFDQAYQMRPAIIFFDEIDGLAPVRSSRQDQIHSSIVSTLLALMDGLDNRGEVVVIGATNRIDSIDPALRRPGRFDREFLFPLPTVEARKQILEIHTRPWEPKLSPDFLAELAEKCVGYCGADLKSLCTEAALQALRRRYPQIYTSDDKLQLDVTSINVNAHDFHNGMKTIVPASQRSVTSPARALLHSVRPLLHATLQRTLAAINRKFPKALAERASLDNHDEFPSDSDDEGPEIFQSPLKGRQKRRFNSHMEGVVTGPYLDFTCQAVNTPATHRPRLLMAGGEGQGQSTHLGPAVLHSLERMPVHVLDLPALFAVSAKTPEESCAQIFREAKRSSPSLLYIPHLCQWWEVISEACKATFLSLLQDIEPLAPLMLLATADVPYLQLPTQVQDLFSINSGEVILMQNPTDTERYEYFKDLLLKQACKAPSTKKKAAQRLLEQLPKAMPTEPRQLTQVETNRLRQHEEATMRELRLFLRDVLTKLGRDRKFGIFSKPVDAEEVPDYYNVIEKPMDMSTMMSKLDLKKYECVSDFMKDIDLICSNALEYNPDKDPQGRIIRHRACAFKDTAEAIVNTELDADFEKLCKEIRQSRKNRGESPKKNVPDYYFTKPISHTALNALQLDPQGLQIDEAVVPGNQRHSGQHRSHPATRSSSYQQSVKVVFQGKNSPSSAANTQEALELAYEEINGKRYRKIIRKKVIPKKRFDKHKQSPFCQSTRRKMRNVIHYVDEHGNEFTKSELLGDENPEKKEKEQEEEDKPEMGTEDNITPSGAGDQTSASGEQKLANSVTTALTIDTTSVDDCDAEKENNPLPVHSPRIRTGSGSRRTRSFSGGDERSKSPQRSKSPRTRSPRTTHSPRTHSPRVNSPKTHSPRISSNPGRTRFAESEKDKIGLSVEKDIVETESLNVRKRTTSQSLSETQDVNSADQVKTRNSSVSPNKMDTSLSEQKSPGKCTEMKPVSNCIEKSPHSRQVENSPKKISPGKKVASPSQSKEEEMEQEEDTKRSPAGHRRTRSQTHNKQFHKAVDILEKHTPVLTIDMDRLKEILAKTVRKTQAFHMEKLERLYSVLSQCIYHHRQEYDKTQLLQELEAAVDKF